MRRPVCVRELEATGKREMHLLDSDDLLAVLYEMEKRMVDMMDRLRATEVRLSDAERILFPSDPIVEPSG